MTRWPARRLPPPVEPPAWVRTFDPEQWRDDQADGAMLGPMRVLSEDGAAEVRDWHAWRRWQVEVNAWYRLNPGADDRLEAIRQRRASRRYALGYDDERRDG